MSNTEQVDNWHHSFDPYGVLCVGDLIDNGQTKIIGFCSPGGLTPSRLMVNIKYSNEGQTTRDYASILVDHVKRLTAAKDEAVQLVNEVYDIVRCYDPDRYIDRIKWKKSWLERADKLENLK
jgi:hypothetical protein